MAEINLLGNDTIDPASITAKSLRLVSSLLFAVLLLMLLSYGYFSFSSWGNGNKIEDVQKKTSAATQEVAQNPQRLEVVTRQGQIQEVNSLLSKHLYWSYLLPELSRVTLSSAGYTRITADDKGKLDLTVAVPTYQDLEKYLQVFNLPEYHQNFSNVRITSISRTSVNEQLAIQAQIRLDFDPKFLRDKGR